jgi:hypothetical protein
VAPIAATPFLTVGLRPHAVIGETRKTKSSTTVALRLNILTSPLIFRIDFKDEPKFAGYYENNCDEELAAD